MNVFRTIIAPALVLAAGVGITRFVVSGAPKAERKAPPLAPATVGVVVASIETTPAVVRATGTVEAARRLQVVPEVTGKLVELHPQLVPGGRVPKGATLARIDDRDFRLAVPAEEGRLRQAELELQVEESRQSIAQREWTLLSPDQSAESAPLALRGPQLETARSTVASARAGLDRAKLNLSRTQLVAPFAALVQSEDAEIGQLVGPSRTLATLIGTDEFWVRVSLPVGQLDAIELPHGDRGGSAARITQDLGGGRGLSRDGAVLRLLGELDPQTRTAQLLVGLEDPLSGDGLPILPGAFVSVEITGRPLDGVVRLPRAALIGGDTVWTVVDGKLLHRAVQVAWVTDADVLLTGGVEPGAQVVVTPLALPVDGQPVAVAEGT